MANNFLSEPMVEMYVFETTQLTEQLEQLIIASEKTGCFDAAAIGELFRIMHTIKGSSAMMLLEDISSAAHRMEDVFFFLRESKPRTVDYERLFDLVLEYSDFVKLEVEKIQGGKSADGNAAGLIASIEEYLAALKGMNPGGAEQPAAQAPAAKQQYYISQQKSPASSGNRCFTATLRFDAGCGMENIRAYTVLHTLKDFAEDLYYIPEDVLENDETASYIRDNGFSLSFRADKSYADMEAFFQKTIFLRELVLQEGIMLEKTAAPVREGDAPAQAESQPQAEERDGSASHHQSMISVNVGKLDRLMDLVGELVIAEAMVTQNSDLRGLSLDSFQKAARQLGKITGELQDTVMSIRMVPLATTFHKMHRIARDMSKKLGKDVELVLIGEDTEVDKNVIEHISDPLMHLIRNAIDHGIETPADRQLAGKRPTGKVTLEAKHAGSEVLILIKDDGRGLDREQILRKARDNGLIHKPEQELTDREIYSFIFLPGFSTKEKVSEFSGRGVGMDVVTKNINSVGGMVVVDSTPGQGSVITLRIPLTLAIVDGMMVGVGPARYTIPIAAIRESFRPKAKELIADPDGNEMIMVRGQCYPILRLHQVFGVNEARSELADGIMMIVENDNDSLCLFADQLIGEQQVVVKALPQYIKSFKKARGLAGCTLLGDGSISLILDINGLMNLGYTG